MIEKIIAKVNSANSQSKPKFVPSQQNAELIENYFVCSNFQDFNNWQQIAKTKTEFVYEEVGPQLFDCSAILRWEGTEKLINYSVQAKSKKDAKKKALLKIIRTLIETGDIVKGFKSSDFLEKIPKRKITKDFVNYDFGDQFYRAKNETSLKFGKNLTESKILDQVTIYNLDEIWTYSLYLKDLSLCSKVLAKVFCNRFQPSKTTSVLEGVSVFEQEEPSAMLRIHKQFVCQGQLKNPLEGDLTDFLPYKQSQLQFFTSQPTKNSQMWIPSKPNTHQILLPSDFFCSQQDSAEQKISSFVPIQIQCDLLRESQVKTHEESSTFVKPLFHELSDFTSLPVFDEEQNQSTLVDIRLVDCLFNRALIKSEDYSFCATVLKKLTDEIPIDSVALQNDDQSRKAEIPLQKKKVSQKAIRYYLEKKYIIASEMSFNLYETLKTPKMNQVTLEGMVSAIGARSKLDWVVTFNSKEPQNVFEAKVERRHNYSEFRQENVFYTEDYVVLMNNIDQSQLLGTIREILSDGFKIQISQFPFRNSSDSFPISASVKKLVNGKVFNKMSAALLQVAQDRPHYVGSHQKKPDSLYLFYQPPAVCHFELISELLSDFIAQNFYTLVVSNHASQLWKRLTGIGFQVIQVEPRADQRQLNKLNIICATPLGVCCESLKHHCFDRIIIDEAQNVPEVVSLLSITKTDGKVLLIGDHHLPRSSMQCPNARKSSAEVSLFQRVLKQLGSVCFTIKSSLDYRKIPFEVSYSEWLLETVYCAEEIIPQSPDGQTERKIQTPIVKGFPWPSQDYRLCLVDTDSQKWVNYSSTSHQEEKSYSCNKLCFAVSEVVGSVLNTKFTEAKQVSVCCSQQIKPLLNAYLMHVLMLLDFSEIEIQTTMRSIVINAQGSEFQKNDLIVAIIDETSDPEDLNRTLIASLITAQRGLIIIGDVRKLSKRSALWGNFICWAAQKCLLVRLQNSVSQQF